MTRSLVGYRMRARFIAERLAEGEPTAKIAADLGISDRRVRRIMDRFAVPMSKPHTVRFSFHCARRRAHLVADLARGAGVSPSTMIERIVGTVVDDGIDQAKRRLGKLAEPMGWGE